MTFLELALLEREMDYKYVVRSNHIPLVRTLSDPKFKAVMKILWRILQLETRSKDGKVLINDKITGLFIAFGHDDIKRFRPSDSEDKYNNSKLSDFVAEITVHLIRSKQIACTRCNLISLDELFGAFGFESDHVDKNLIKNGEEKEKEFDVYVSKHSSLLKFLNEVAKTQVRCLFAMLFV